MTELEQAAVELIRARDALRRAKNSRNAVRCEEESAGDEVSGDPGAAACYYSPENGLCESCVKRAVLHAKAKALALPASKALRRLRRLVMDQFTPEPML